MTAAIAAFRAVLAHLREHGVKPPAGFVRGLAQIERAPASEQARLAACLAVRIPALMSLTTQLDTLCPAYPRASIAIQARIALGAAPSSVLKGLTRREAHEALMAGGYDTAVSYLCSEVPTTLQVDSVDVARWLRACWRDTPRRTALEEVRVERVAGEEVRGRLIDRVDEIQPDDLPRGPATGVRDAFERAARRAYAQWEHGAESDATPLAPRPRWWRAVRCARLLDTSAALIAEGRAQRHCVGGYAAAVRAQRSVIVSIRVRVGGVVHASTVELTRDGRSVRQHRGRDNMEPPQLCVAAVRVLMRRWST